jgi:hypothetical protein
MAFGSPTPPSTVGNGRKPWSFLAYSGWSVTWFVYSHDPMRCMAALPCAISVDAPAPSHRTDA